MTAITHDAAARQAYHDLIPMRRYAERDEIAAAARHFSLLTMPLTLTATR